MIVDGVKLANTPSFKDNFQTLSVKTEAQDGRYALAYPWVAPDGRWGLLGRRAGSERQVYADPSKGDPSPFACGAGGGLSITGRVITAAEREADRIRLQPFNVDGKPPLDGFWGQQYISGLIVTQQSFQYGYIEAEVQTPSTVPGTWGAIWLVLDDYTTGSREEFDLIENVGPEADCYHITAHSGTKDAPRKTAKRVPADMRKFHKHGLLWLPDRLVSYLDDVEVMRWPNDGALYTDKQGQLQQNPSIHSRMRLAANLAIGGEWPESIQKHDAAGKPMVDARGKPVFYGAPNPADFPQTMRLRQWKFYQA